MKYKNKLVWLAILAAVLTSLLVGCTTATGVSKSSVSEVSSKASIASDITSSSEDYKNQEGNGMPENGRRASAVYYMPDLSAYPNLDEVTDLPPYEIHVYADGSIVDFNFVTKNAAFKDMIQKIDKVLKADGFTTATEEEYANLTNGLSQFKQGKAQNTYIKLKNNNQDVTPYAIQIIDGGIDKNNLPIIIVKMAGGTAYLDEGSNSQENKAVTENDTRANAAYYMPDLTAYPNLDDELDLPPYEISTDGSVVDFKFVTKNIPFEDMIKKIDERLKADGFSSSTEEQYTNLTNGLNQFKQGKAENTYIKLKTDKDVTPYAIQIIDSGVDKSNLPIVTVKMAG